MANSANVCTRTRNERAPRTIISPRRRSLGPYTGREVGKHSDRLYPGTVRRRARAPDGENPMVELFVGRRSPITVFKADHDERARIRRRNISGDNAAYHGNVSERTVFVGNAN